VRNPSELPPDRRVNPRMPMAVQVRPNGRVGVEVLTSADVPQDGAAARHDHDRFPSQPVAHLRERMPDMAMIEAGERMHEMNYATPAAERVTPRAVASS
jgi:hypothetical protein